MREDVERLQDILEAIEKIEKYSREGRTAVEADERTQVWIVYHLEILGEAANNISRAVQKAHPEIPWGKIIGMRNILAHQYFGIDVDLVWKAVEQDLPGLRPAIEHIYRELVRTSNE